MKRPGRRHRYTQIGIRRLPCFRCGARSEYQWNVCADGLFRTLCVRCDVGLNALVLRWMKDPEAEKKIARYRASSSR
jgi:hypothetical protein